MSLTTEQVVTQLQPEVITLKSQVTDQTGLAEAARAHLQSRAQLKLGKDTPSLIDVKGLGSPKEFTDKEEDFQQCRRRRKRSLLESLIILGSGQLKSRKSRKSIVSWNFRRLRRTFREVYLT